MATYFHFLYQNPDNEDDHWSFNGQLLSLRCTFEKPNGSQCKRRCVVGLPCCASHLPVKFHVKVKDSLLKGAGKGLFAYDSKKDPNAVIFTGEQHRRRAIIKGDKIVPYHGEILSKAQLDARYHNETAPYGIYISKNRFEDGALERGVGTLVNHKPKAQSNAEFIVSNNRVWLRATKTIRNGEELYVNYGNSYRFNERGVTTYTDHKRNPPRQAKFH